MAHYINSVHPDAIIGKDVVIESFSTIYGDVRIGDNSWIGPNVTVMDGARIGSNCRVFPGAVISAIPQDLKFAGEITTVEIGDNTTIRECVTINRGTKSKGKTVIGSDCLVMSYVHVAHDCVVGDHCVLAGYVGLAGEVEIEDWATLGGGSLVHQFVRIGTHAFVQGGSKVGKDVPPYTLAGRDPLAYAGLNIVGLKRRNFSQKKIQELNEIYRAIYQKGTNHSDAVNYVESHFTASVERDHILAFIKSSERGIVRSLLDD
ncbi:MAG TPA: acyl-ACP--UDP-N-acetylglucosamine O-acyltransferase [Saprospiraceae bacterium]|nr:acyl-ACP--UDP-N-acetylglucosamine O-acyltransferase [Saprospiraceae bacterium]